jgi:NADH:ubiquinone oxidoreductase subunit 6 (subunit J)
MVLFLFVIMLLGVTRDDLLFETRLSHKIGAGLGGAAFVLLILFAFAGDFTGPASRCGAQAGTAASADAAACQGLDTLLAETDEGSVGIIARRMFTRYTFPFEASALLLVVATIGALVIGRRHDPAPDEDFPDGGGSAAGLSDGGGSAARRSPHADLGGASASDRPSDAGLRGASASDRPSDSGPEVR